MEMGEEVTGAVQLRESETNSVRIISLRATCISLHGIIITTYLGIVSP